VEFIERLRVALEGRYRIERELGGGGMSRVFLAEETALGRKVVVKVLPPEMGAGVNADRFRREIQLAASLQHPHIVPLLNAGQTDDLVWYTMPLIEGESLRTRLAREGELPIHEVVRLLRDVADALAYAHEHGVVHRDIKPDNVLLSGHHAVVTDFGVSKAITAATGEASLTSVGVALGTPAYMAPEQAAAEPHVDHRADVYALGAMAYEMLTGSPPFAGEAQVVLAAHVTRAPEPVTARRAAVSPAFAALVMRCLEKKAADRWQSAAELHEQLELMTTPSGGTTPTGVVAGAGAQAKWRPGVLARVAAAAVVVVLAVAGYAWWHIRVPPAAPPDVREPVLVLPYEEHVASPGLRGIGQQVADRFEAGITEATLGAVLQRRTVAALGTGAGTPDEMRRVARTSGAATLVTGVVYERGDSVEVQSQVLRARDLLTLFSLAPERGAARDVEHVIEAAKERVLAAVGYYVSPRTKGLLDVTMFRPPRALDVVHLLERGDQLLFQQEYAAALAAYGEAHRRDTGLLQVALLTHTALFNLGREREADSVLRFVEARRAGLTTGEDLVLNMLQSWHLSPEEEYRATTDAVRRDSGQFWIYQGLYAAYRANHLSEALSYYRRRDTTVAFSRDWPAWYFYAAAAMHALRRYTDELALAREARAKQPDHYFHALAEARALIGLGRLAEVEEVLTESRTLPAPSAPGRLMHDVALELNAHGLRDDAQRMWSRALAWHAAQPPGSADEQVIRRNVAFERYYLRQYDEARQAFASLLARLPDDRFYRAGTAYVAARTGDTTLALQTVAGLRADTSTNDTYAARILALLGRKEEAVAALRQYLNRGGRAPGWWHTVPEFDGLRDYPPFVALTAPKD
jgi:tRNA A-37 threonylcarbamoyl transferase component Bud32/tetratricopeptide (TPR) repeat protein